MIYTRTVEPTPYTSMNCTNNFSTILEQQLSFHGVKDVSINGARKCQKWGGYTTSILINSNSGERFEVSLFSDEGKENIKLNKVSFTKYCDKLFAKKD
jgi:pimeloyl-CoA synthetase